jgi:signal transduction histidine kinase
MLASIFAHDVKSPTLSIRALVSTIDSQVEDLNIKNYLARIDRHAKLIADSFPAFPKRPEVVAINLSKILQEVLEKRKEEFSQYNIQVKTDLDQMPPVKGDSWMLAFVIDNMIKNAVRFLQNGGTLAFRGHKVNKQLLLDIIDSGPGVSEAVLPQLYRGVVLDPESKGNGYGLLLIKHILNELDGDIGLPTRDERGNVFTIELPLV